MLAAFNGQAADLKGNAVTDFQVEVRREIAGTPLASIFADRDGATPLGNPFTPNPDDNGRFRFHVAGGAYRIRLFDGNGFEVIWRYVAIGLAGESDDAPMPGYGFLWSTETADEDPGSGFMRANNASLASATVLFASDANEAGSDIASRLLALTASDALILQAPDGRQAAFDIDGVAEGDDSPPSYVKITISGHSGETAFESGERVSLLPLIKGDDATGDVEGPDGGVAAGQLAAFGDTTGKVIEGADLGDSPPTPVQVGSDADVRAAAPGKVIHAGHLESAAAAVALNESGGNIALDWSAGINFTMAMAGNYTLSNPSNGQPGSWREILFTQDGTGNRTLAFDTQYVFPAGTAPTLSTDPGAIDRLMILAV